MRILPTVGLGFALATAVAANASAAAFFFSTGSPDGLLAAGARLPGNGLIEVETADDFILAQNTVLTSASFTGLLPAGATVGDIKQVNVEIYRIFPLDSDTTRTPNVPTRNNSPSDVDLADRDSIAGTLSYSTTILGSFAAANSILNDIHPSPDQLTHGEGVVTGLEALFNVNFTTPIALAPDHYFFRPGVLLDNGSFYWLSAPKPNLLPGMTITPDLQSWSRNAALAPDWLRDGTDIIGAGTFNMSFSLTGSTAVPEPAAWALMIGGMALVGGVLRRRRGLLAV